jgi:hypothetical protein
VNCDNFESHARSVVTTLSLGRRHLAFECGATYPRQAFFIK